MSAEDRILLIDDEPAILSGYRRSLLSQYDVATATSGAEALELIQSSEPFAVVVSDFMMPSMNGVELLRAVAQVNPETVRVMITGNHDLHTAMKAVNEGCVFRFLTKPCDPKDLVTTLEAALEQHRLIQSEKLLLEGTLRGSVEVLTEILSMANPDLFGRVEQLRRQARNIARAMGVRQTWEIEVATMLSQIGSVLIPPIVLVRHRHGKLLTRVEKEMLGQVPETGYRLLSRIPRLERVAEIVRYQDRPFNASDEPCRQGIPLGARILKVLRDLQELEMAGVDEQRRFATLVERIERYDPNVLALVCGSADAVEAPAVADQEVEEVACGDLVPGTVLAAAVCDNEGRTLLAAGQVLTPSAIERVQNHAQTSGVAEPILVCAGGAVPEWESLAARA